MNRIINNGKIFNSNNNGDFKILNKLKCSIDSEKYYNINDSNRYIVEFINTGYVSDFSDNSIRKGNIKEYILQLHVYGFQNMIIFKL